MFSYFYLTFRSGSGEASPSQIKKAHLPTAWCGWKMGRALFSVVLSISQGIIQILHCCCRYGRDALKGEFTLFYVCIAYSLLPYSTFTCRLADLRFKVASGRSQAAGDRKELAPGRLPDNGPRTGFFFLCFDKPRLN